MLIQPAFRPTSLNNLRSNVSDADRRLLDMCWANYRMNGKHLKVRAAYSEFTKPEADAAVDRLTGNLIRRCSSSDTPGENYEITCLGALVSSEGENLEHLIERYVLAVKALYEKTPEIRLLSSSELMPFLNVVEADSTQEDLVNLGKLQLLGLRLIDTSLGGLQSDGTWSINIGDNVEEVRRISDVKQFIQQELIKEYKSAKPVGELERTNHVLMQRNSLVPIGVSERIPNVGEVDSPPHLLFMKNEQLRAICNSDWKEALLAKRHGLLKSAMILCGAVAECLLLDCLEQIPAKRLDAARKSRKVSRTLNQMGLDEMVRVAHELSRIQSPNDNLAHFLREYRNFVHPARQRHRAGTVSDDDVSAALFSLRVLTRDLSRPPE